MTSSLASMWTGLRGPISIVACMPAETWTEVKLPTSRSSLRAAAAASARSEDRDVGSFTSVHVSAGMHATIEIGPRRPVHIEASDDVIKLIETVVEDGALQVRYRPHSFIQNTGEVRISIQTPELH